MLPFPVKISTSLLFKNFFYMEHQIIKILLKIRGIVKTGAFFRHT